MKTYLFILITLFFISCESPQIEHEKSSGKINEIPAGKAFRINLPEDHTSGYSWSLDEKFDAGVVMYMGSVFRSNTKGVDFKFEGVNPGQTELRFIHRKHFDTLAVKSFIIRVN